jgi:hypothetical protein
MAYGQGSISRSIISGNSGLGYADEAYNSDSLVVDDFNLFGHGGITTAEAIGGFTPGPSDILATSDGTLPTILPTLLDTLLQNHGGPTDTHALPLTSPAIDGVSNGCAAGMEDQRHLPRGGGSGMGGPFCDIGAFEVQSPNTSADVFMPAVLKANTTQNAPQATRPNSLVMGLLLGLFTVSPLGLFKNKLSRFRKTNNA